ncbi:MAG TPA: hypothetical protein VMZ50_08290 [Phycisphaerae bacterium]|nr:hypothetical protein [Phycisphaerae bacterium]
MTEPRLVDYEDSVRDADKFGVAVDVAGPVLDAAGIGHRGANDRFILVHETCAGYEGAGIPLYQLPGGSQVCGGCGRVLPPAEAAAACEAAADRMREGDGGGPARGEDFELKE